LPGHLNTAVGAGVGVSGAGVVAGGLDDVGIRSTINGAPQLDFTLEAI